MNINVESKPTTRRYTPEQKDQAVRMVFALRRELGTSQGTVKRVGDQLGIGVESVRSWVKQGEIGTGVRSRRRLQSGLQIEGRWARTVIFSRFEMGGEPEVHRQR
jgi:transposase-like protein